MPYTVEGLSVVPVDNAADVKLRVLQGDRRRTIAATKMNECSSRAHTIVCLRFAQNHVRRKRTKVAAITLVDLAGRLILLHYNAITSTTTNTMC